MKKINKSVLISVGTNSYRDRTIEQLYYCVSDCYRVHRVFNTFNVCNFFVTLTEKEATIARILHEIKNARDNTENIFFYFSGHGISINNISYLYTYDTNINNIEVSALSLPFLIQQFKKLKFLSVTLVFDACNIIRPPACSKTVQIISPKNFKAFEDTLINKGSFTNQFLKDIANKYKINYKNNNLTKRYQKVRQEIELALLTKNDLLFLIGHSGIGKSHFFRQIKTLEQNVCYLSLPNQRNLSFEIVLNLISECFSTALASQNKTTDTDPERYIRFITQTKPHSLLLVDHTDHLNPPVLHKLIKFLYELPIQKILSSRFCSKAISSRGYIYNFPQLSNREVEEILDLLKIEDKKLRILCKKQANGSYINILKTISSFNNSLTYTKYTKNKFLNCSMKKTMLAIIASGGFIHQELFENIFNVNHRDIEQLKKLGMIVLHEDFFYPHDSIYDSIREFDLKPFKQMACEYWKLEINRNTHHTNAIQNYIIVSNSFSPKFNTSDIPLYKNIINKLEGRQNIYFLLMIFNYLKSKKIPHNLRIFFGNALIDIGKFQEAISLIKSEKIDLTLESSTLLAEINWWEGRFLACIQLSSQLLFKKPSYSIYINLLCSRGIGYFFMGDWVKAKIDLEMVIQKNNQLIPQKPMFFAYCVLATIQGIRGTDFQKSVINFKQAITIAKQLGKLFWLALVYGNIGEILWKAGFLEKSIEILEIGAQMAYLAGNDTLELEINRNLLHVYHRSKKHVQEKGQLKKLEKTFNEKLDSYVKMQIINSLITHYIFSSKTKYKNYLKTAQRLTKNNAEYLIYTKANLAIAKLLEGNTKEAIKLMKQSLTLGYSGENWLSIKQILDDWDEVIILRHLFPFATKQIFQKWHQVLEKKLVPNLFHLSHLCEYLESP